MNIKPLNGHVVIQPVDLPDKTQSGIVLPQTRDKESWTGLVVAVSPGAPVKEGQEVVFKKWSGEPFKHGGAQYILLAENDLLAIITS